MRKSSAVLAAAYLICLWLSDSVLVHSHFEESRSVPSAVLLASDFVRETRPSSTSAAATAETVLEDSDIKINNVELERILTSGSSVSPGNKRELTSSIDYQPSACQLVPVVHLLNHPGCQPKAIASFACSGSCPSYVKHATRTKQCPLQTSTSNFWQHERSCSCCQQTGSQEATFALDCPSLDPPYRKVKTHAPVDCLCRACTDLSREDLRPQELIEALASEKNSGFSFQTS